MIRSDSSPRAVSRMIGTWLTERTHRQTLEAVHLGQHDVQDDEVGDLLTDRSARRLAVSCLARLEALPVEVAHDDVLAPPRRRRPTSTDAIGPAYRRGACFSMVPMAMVPRLRSCGLVASGAPYISLNRPREHVSPARGGDGVPPTLRRAWNRARRTTGFPSPRCRSPSVRCLRGRLSPTAERP